MLHSRCHLRSEQKKFIWAKLRQGQITVLPSQSLCYESNRFMQPGEQHGRLLLRRQSPDPCSLNRLLRSSADEDEDEDATATFGCAIMSNGVMPGIIYLGALLASAFGIGMNVCALWSFVYIHTQVYIIIFFHVGILRSERLRMVL